MPGSIASTPRLAVSKGGPPRRDLVDRANEREFWRPSPGMRSIHVRRGNLTMSDMSVTFVGKKLRNPIGVASHALTSAEHDPEALAQHLKGYVDLGASRWPAQNPLGLHATTPDRWCQRIVITATGCQNRVCVGC